MGWFGRNGGGKQPDSTPGYRLDEAVIQQQKRDAAEKARNIEEGRRHDAKLAGQRIDHGNRAQALQQPGPAERMQRAPMEPHLRAEQQQAREQQGRPKTVSYKQVFGEQARQEMQKQREQTREQDRNIASGKQLPPAQPISTLPPKERGRGR